MNNSTPDLLGGNLNLIGRCLKLWKRAANGRKLEEIFRIGGQGE